MTHDWRDRDIGKYYGRKRDGKRNDMSTDLSHNSCGFCSGDTVSISYIIMFSK